MLRNYLTTAFRAFRKSSVYGILNITGLALGIACAALIFLWIEDEVSYDHYHTKHNRLYSLRMNLDYSGKIESYGAVPGPMGAAVRETVPGIVNHSRVGFGRELFALNDESTYESGLYVDTGFFSMMHVPFVKGNAAGFNDPHTIVLSEKMARKLFGDTNPVGRTVRVNNTQNYVVLGVVRDQPQNVTIEFNWLAPVVNHVEKNQWLNSWGTYGITTVVELKEGVLPQAINPQLTAILQPKSNWYKNSTCFLESMNDWRLRGNYTDGKQDGGQIRYVRIFSAIAWIILIIACINFMNLATARAGQRAREIGVRKTLGAVRYALIGQFMVEILLMSFMALLLAVLLIYLSLPYFNTLVGKQLSFEPLAPVHLLGLLALCTLCGFIAGSYPAFFLSSFNPVHVLKGQRIGANKGAGFIRRGLVVTQFAISVILVVCTVIIYQQVQHIKDRNLGYNKEHLLYMNIKGKMATNFDAIRTQLLQTGLVADAALSGSPPLEVWYTSTTEDWTWQGSDPLNKIKLSTDVASPEYLSTMGLELKAGRNFRADIVSDSLSVIINESMAKLMGEQGKVGSMLIYASRFKKLEVIGIIKDHLFNNMYGPVSPLILRTAPKTHTSYVALNIRIKPGSRLSTALAQIEAVIRTNNPGFPFEYQFADQKFDQLFLSESRTGKLAGIFAMLTIIISCLGLFGLAAYTAEQRTKEIGIRKLLGASATGLAAMLAKEFVLLVALACLIAFPLAWAAMHNWLADYSYRITIHWWVFGVTGIVALLIALLTVSFQAVRSALSNPVDCLRSE